MRIELQGIPVVGEKLFIALKGTDEHPRNFNFVWLEIRLEPSGDFTVKPIDNEGLVFHPKPEHAGAMIGVRVSGLSRTKSRTCVTWPIMTIDTVNRMRGMDFPLRLEPLLDQNALLEEWAALSAMRADLIKGDINISKSAKLNSHLSSTHQLQSKAFEVTQRANEILRQANSIHEEAKSSEVSAATKNLETRKMLETLKLNENHIGLKETIELLEWKKFNLTREIKGLKKKLADTAVEQKEIIEYAEVKAEKIVRDADATAKAIINMAEKSAAQQRQELDLLVTDFKSNTDLKKQIDRAHKLQRDLAVEKQYLSNQINIWLEARQMGIHATDELVQKLLSLLPEQIEQAKATKRALEREKRRRPEDQLHLCGNCGVALSVCNC